MNTPQHEQTRLYLKQWQKAAVRGIEQHAVTMTLLSEAYERIRILEEKLEQTHGANPMTTTEKKAEPFRVTGPGKYLMRNGDSVNIEEARWGPWPWKTDQNWSYGYYSDGKMRLADMDGFDLIARIDDEQAEMAGLSGYITLSPDGRAYSGKAIDARSATVPETHVIVDLSTIRKDQLVKPEPRTETRKVWVNVYPADEPDNGVFHSTRASADASAGDKRIACVEHEITFTHGEGLGGNHG